MSLRNIVTSIALVGGLAGIVSGCGSKPETFEGFPELLNGGKVVSLYIPTEGGVTLVKKLANGGEPSSKHGNYTNYKNGDIIKDGYLVNVLESTNPDNMLLAFTGKFFYEIAGHFLNSEKDNEFLRATRYGTVTIEVSKQYGERILQESGRIYMVSEESNSKPFTASVLQYHNVVPSDDYQHKRKNELGNNPSQITAEFRGLDGVVNGYSVISVHISTSGQINQVSAIPARVYVMADSHGVRKISGTFEYNIDGMDGLSGNMIVDERQGIVLLVPKAK